MRLGTWIEVLELFFRLAEQLIPLAESKIMRNHQTSNEQDSGATEA